MTDQQERPREPKDMRKKRLEKLAKWRAKQGAYQEPDMGGAPLKSLTTALIKGPRHRTKEARKNYNAIRDGLVLDVGDAPAALPPTPSPRTENDELPVGPLKLDLE